jgi:Tol biopolymer transport system component/predicted Ser/Thr protein kinase
LIGKTLAHYEITASLGAGGMGEVYRATDTKLGRDVAIKVLPQDWSADPERVARFDREARTLARLQHAKVASIYGFEEDAGTRFLVMELVEGQDLQQRIRSGPLSPGDAIDIARQIAAGLEAAHDEGIVHRDLKPANVRITPEGEVKILDFGLARAIMDDPALEADPSGSPTITEALTGHGAILGTAPYMSPEQARGESLDRRTDIWAFGCVLYEMLTGAPPFRGRGATEIFAEIMKSEPDWNALPEETPGGIRTLVWCCLQKNPRERLRDIGDARFYLDGPEPAIVGNFPEGPEFVARPRKGARIAALAALVLAVGALLIFLGQRSPVAVDAAPTLRFVVDPPEGRPFTAPGLGGSPAFSPDGRKLAFVASSDARGTLWIRDMVSAQDRELPGTEGASHPFWSPDGQSIAYFANSQLSVVPSEGGKSRVICDTNIGRGGSWSPDGTIVFARSYDAGLWRVEGPGSSPQLLTDLDDDRVETSHRWPCFLPDGRRYLYLAWSSRPESSAIYLGDLDSPTRRLLVQSRSNAILDPTGYLIYSDGEQLLAVAFDTDRGQVTGEPFVIPSQIDESDLLESASLPMTVSTDGVLAYATLDNESRTSNPVELVRYDLDGERGPTIAPGIRDPALSPDGRWIAGSRTVPENSFWLLDLEAGTETKFVFDTSRNFMPVWSPDTRQIAFASNRNGRYDLYLKPANGSTGEELILFTEGTSLPTSWSSNGRLLLYQHLGEDGNEDLWILPMDEADNPQLYIGTDAEEIQGQFSPDGNWVAYCSNESGEWEIYVQPYPVTGGKWLVSAGGGTQPRWQANGKRLFYLSKDDYIVAVDIDTTGEALQASAPEPLFHIPNPPGDAANTDEFVVSPDGKTFYATVNVDEQDMNQTRRILFVVNWSTEFGQN